LQDILKIVLQKFERGKSYGCLHLKVRFCNSTSINVVTIELFNFS